MRLSRLAGLVMVVALAASGCGASKTSTTATASKDSTAKDSTAKDTAKNGGDFCEIARKQAKTLLGGDDTALQEAMAQIFDPSKASEGKAALKAYVQKAKVGNAEFVAKAPAELKKDLAVITTVSNKLFDAFDKADYDFTKIDVSDLSEVDTPEVKAATERLSTYLKKTCGVDVDLKG